jgi:hypothetical protein
MMKAECDDGGRSSRLCVGVCVCVRVPLCSDCSHVYSTLVGFSLVFDRCWDGIVGIALAMGLTARGWNPGGVQRFYFYHTRSLGPPSSCAVGTGTLSRR